MKTFFTSLALAGTFSLAAATSCCFSQNITFDTYEPQTPAGSLVAQSVEFGGIKFNSIGVASQIPGLNVGPKPRSAPNYMYYGPTTGVGATGYTTLSVVGDESPHSSFYVKSFGGGCGIALPPNPLPGSDLVKLRCTVQFEAFVGSESKGTQDFVFLTGDGTQQLLNSVVVDPGTFTTLKWTTLRMRTTRFEVKVGPLGQFVDLSQLPGARPYVFIDDIGTVVSPKTCAACAAK